MHKHNGGGQKFIKFLNDDYKLITN